MENQLNKAMKIKILIGSILMGFLFGCHSNDGMDENVAKQYDIIIRGGTLYDGTGEESIPGDVAIVDDRIVALGDIGPATAHHEIDATGLAVAPGFANIMSHSHASLFQDGRALSDIKQGVTFEIFGEGKSMGPLTGPMKENYINTLGRGVIQPKWTSLGEALEYMEAQGVSPNIGSFVGAATLRIHEVGHDNRKASKEEIEGMKELMRAAMREGALGVASSLIYPPGSFADTNELIEISKAAAEYGGIYASHMRSEGDGIFDALDETITIAREARISTEIFHLKLASPRVWNRFDDMITKIQSAQKEGLDITADIYPYPAGSTGLDSVFPEWVKTGKREEWVARLKDPEARKQAIQDMNTPSLDWENMFNYAGADGILLVSFGNKKLSKYVGKTLAEIARERKTLPEETAMDLFIEDGGRPMAVYFTQSEEVVRKLTAMPWVGYTSDAAALAAEGDFLNNSIHPRAYGAFARVLGKYVREEKMLSLSEAIRKLSALPMDILSVKNRGYLKEGYYADIAIFNPDIIADKATFEKPHQYAIGMEYVLVNGKLVLDKGEPTDARPGRFIRGPGWKP